MVCCSSDKTVFSFTLTEEKNKAVMWINFEYYTQSEKTPYVLSAPLLTKESSYKAHVIVTDERAALLINDILADEDWPLSSIAWKDDVILHISPAVADVNIFERKYPLPADFIPIVPQQNTSALQYWKPEGHNTNIGDCMPFWHNGIFYLFYLFDRRGHRSKHGYGAHQWAHASSCDLVHWIHHEMAIPITNQWEGSICTGSVLFHEGIYYAFYTVRMTDSSA